MAWAVAENVPEDERLRLPSAVRSVSRALLLLRIMGRTERTAWSLDELSRVSGFAKSTTHRLLVTMVESGFVEPCERSGYYRLGLQASVIGAASSRSRDAHPDIRRVLQWVARKTRCTSGLALLSDAHSVTLFRVCATDSIRADHATNGISPAHASAAGKVLLSGIPESDLTLRFAERSILPGYTPATITSVPRLVEELAAVRQNGYATDVGEYRVGLRCVAVAVQPTRLDLQYAVGVTDSGRPEALLKSLPILLKAAEELSPLLGSR